MLEHHDIICLASSSYYARSWLNVQHIMNRLAGPNRVLYVESIGLRGARLSRGGDLGRLLARLKLFLTGLKRPKPGLAVLSPAAFPFARTARVERWNRKLLIRQIRRAARRQMIVKAVYQGPIPAPIRTGQQIATLVIETPETETIRLPLYAGGDVGRLGLVGRLGAALNYLVWGAAQTMAP